MNSSSADGANGLVDRRTFLGAAGAGALGTVAGCIGGGGDGDYPNEEIEVIVAFPAGGGTDRTGRQIVDIAQEHLDASMYVTNVEGGGGVTGFTRLMNADPDGYTIGIVTIGLSIFQPLGIADITPDDYDPVMQFNADPAGITVHEDSPYGSLDDFVSAAEDDPGSIQVSTDGEGGIWHIAGVGFQQAAGVELDYIGYEGGEPATTAVVNGEVDATTSSVPEVAPQVEGGPLELLAVMGDERHSNFPDTPTLQEAGYDFSLGAWRGVGTPAGVDQERIDVLHDAFYEAYQSDEFQDFMAEQGFGTIYRDQEEFGQFWDEDLQRFQGLVDDMGI